MKTLPTFQVWANGEPLEVRMAYALDNILCRPRLQTIFCPFELCHPLLSLMPDMHHDCSMQCAPFLQTVTGGTPMKVIELVNKYAGEFLSLACTHQA